MKKLALSIFLISLYACSFAQNNIGINNTTPPASAALMVDTAASGPQGLMIPRMTQGRRNVISSPATGLMIFQTDNTPGFYYYNGSSWSAVAGAAVYPNVEVNTSVASSQTISDLINANPPTFTILNFSSVNNANASLTGGNSWNGNTFTAGAGGAGWYQVTVQVIASAVSGSNNNAASNILPMMFLDKNNFFGTNPGNNTAPAYVNSTTNNSVFPYVWGNYVAAGSTNPWLKNAAQLNATIYLAAGDFINLKACSESTSATARTSSDGSSNITITRIK